MIQPNKSKFYNIVSPKAGVSVLLQDILTYEYLERELSKSITQHKEQSHHIKYDAPIPRIEDYILRV